MKLLVTFFFIGLLTASAATYSQEVKFNMELKNVSVKEVFDQIEENSDYVLFYNEDYVDVNRLVDVDASGRDVRSILDQVFRGTKNSYKIYDRQIVILGPGMNDSSSGVKAKIEQARGKKITGIVTGTDGAPIPGVTVLIKGTTKGTITDADGRFSLLNVGENQTLVFSFVGMKSQEVPVAGKSAINVVMRENTIGLEEVVAVGYGVQKKVNLTGAVSNIKGKTLEQKASTDVLSSMQGELPGVAVLRGSGQPGSETSGIRIRGFSSANSTSALVLIDGVEGDITLLNPDDIESISVLKDASAAAIYGARAAAGVILVTTKSGSKSGKVKVNYHGYYGINTPGNMPERVTAWQEQNLINISRFNASGSPEWNPEQTAWVANPNFNYRPNITKGRWDYFSATNWVHAGTKAYTTQQSHSVSVSGGNHKLNYRFSTGYYTKSGLLKYGPDGYNRYNLRFKLNSDISKYVSVGAEISYVGSFTKTNPYGAKSILERLYRIRGRQPIYVPAEDKTGNIYNGDLQVNPIDLMKNGGEADSRWENYMGKGNLTIKNVIPGLELNLMASRQNGYYNSEVTKRHLVWYNMTGTGIRFEVNNPNSLSRTKNYDYHNDIETTLTYDLKFGRNTFKALAGTSYEDYRKDQMGATAYAMNSNDFYSFNYYDTSVATNSSLSDEIDTWAMNSYFGRINYNYDDRYLFEANVRYDGSSRLSPENRWQAFPSFSAGWRINNEKWFHVEPISNMKLRASWGQLGNGAVLGLYDYIATISSGDLMGQSYYYQPSLASQSKTWETIETTDIGLDLGLFKNRLTMTGDYYWKYNKNMLATLQVPSLIGVSVSNANVGKLKTWGWEFDVNWRDKVGDFSYQVGFNLSDSQNKLIKYDGKSVVSPGTVSLLQGYPMNSIWAYKTDGYWSSRDEYLAYKKDHPGYETFNDSKISGGDIRYVAQGKPDHQIGAGDGTPQDPGDLVYMGTTNGRYLFGVNFSAQWKGFDFSMFWQGVGKRHFLIATSTLAPFYSTSTMPWKIDLDYWTPDNPNAYFPRMYNNKGNDFNFKPSDHFLQNGAYIRLKNIQLGYTLPIKNRIIDHARVYVAGNDVCEFSKIKYKVFDPEVGNNASADYYPFFRTWALGLDVSF